MLNCSRLKIINAILLTTILYIVPISAQQNLIERERKSLAGILSKANTVSLADITLMEGYDIKFCKLDLNVTNLDCSISGTVTIRAQVTVSTFPEFVIELIDENYSPTNSFSVSSVKLNGVNTPFTHADDLLIVRLETPLTNADYFSVEINYSGYSELSSSTEYSGLSSEESFGSTILDSSINFFGAKFVFPCKQNLVDKIDTLFTFITTNSDCKVASIGKLESVVPLPNDKIRYEWKSYYPIDYYLIYFSVAPFIEDIREVVVVNEENPIILQSFLIPNSPYLNTQYEAIDTTETLLQLYSELFGSYPFKNEKYGYAIGPNQWGAMEYQTLTMMGYEALDLTTSVIGIYSFWYTAHELGHSWFGDNVTPATFGDIWISEGFASYIEYIAHERVHSAFIAKQWMENAMKIAKSKYDGSVYVPESYWNDENKILDYELEYKKGAILVHMIRNIIDNDSIFFSILREFQTRYDKSTATAMQFKEVLEEKSGMDFTDFFNQWFYGEGYPEFSFSWSQTENKLSIKSIESTTSATTLLFKMPLEFKLTTASGEKIIRLFQTKNNEIFNIDITNPVTGIQFDPEGWILAKVIQITDLEYEDELQLKFSLEQNYPNPFNPTTQISYTLKEPGFVQLIIYNLLGEEVLNPINQSQEAGMHTININASGLPSGMYIYRLQASAFSDSKKCLLLK